MTKNQLLKSTLVVACMACTSLSSAFDLPEELTYQSNKETADPIKGEISGERYQFAGAGFIFGAAIGGPVGAYTGTVLADQLAIKNENQQQTEHQLNAYREKLAHYEQNFNKMQGEKVVYQNVSLNKVDYGQSETEKLISWGFSPQLYFKTNNNQIEKHYEKKLAKLVYVVQKSPGLQIAISGYADERGTEAMNMDLSRRRAEQVKQFFIDSGVDEKRIKIFAFGEKQAAQPSQEQSVLSRENRFYDRRVDISFSLKGEAI